MQLNPYHILLLLVVISTPRQRRSLTTPSPEYSLTPYHGLVTLLCEIDESIDSASNEATQRDYPLVIHLKNTRKTSFCQSA
jgi:hypothetical protein